MDKKKRDPEDPAINLVKDPTVGLPVDTNSTDEADADANGDLDDEREDENEAVRSGRE